MLDNRRETSDRAAQVSGGPVYGLEWTMVATVGPLAFGFLLIYLVIRKG